MPIDYLAEVFTLNLVHPFRNMQRGDAVCDRRTVGRGPFLTIPDDTLNSPLAGKQKREVFARLATPDGVGPIVGSTGVKQNEVTPDCRTNSFVNRGHPNIHFCHRSSFVSYQVHDDGPNLQRRRRKKK